MPNCLSTTKSPMTVNFRAWGAKGKIVSSDADEDSNSNNNNKDNNDPARMENVAHEVMCMPLFTVLTALNVTKVDYFSLDVEGNELDILKTLPWGEIEITVRIYFDYLTMVQLATAKHAQSHAPVKEITGSIPGRSMDIHDTQKLIIIIMQILASYDEVYYSWHKILDTGAAPRDYLSSNRAAS